MSITTKFEEEIITTSLIEEMKGKYLAKRLVRTWSEDFVDEDSSEVVEIEKSELIIEKGALLDHDNLSRINFHLQSGDIKEVSISNQKRECFLVKNIASVWVVTIELNTKKKNIYLYADCVESAKSILVDFIEQKYIGGFKIKSIKELDYSNLLTSKIEDEENDDNYYKIESKILYEDNHESFNQNYILNASDVDNAKMLITHFLSAKNEGKRPFELTIISAKTISCNDVVSHEFSKIHLEKID